MSQRRRNSSHPPVKGYTRYYKKIGETRKYDVLVRVKDCGHRAWQRGNRGDKAKKGIARLEGTGEWACLWHCGRCTGGGRWRVRW